MSLGAKVATNLPYLRRYARALTGSQQTGDAFVRATLEAALADAELRTAIGEGRVALYRAFNKVWSSAFVDTVDHFASLFAGRVETEILQDVERVEGNQQAPVLLGPAPRTSSRLEGEKLGSPAFGCDTRPLGGDRAGGFAREVFHDLPADGRVRIEEPFEVRAPGCVGG